MAKTVEKVAVESAANPKAEVGKVAAENINGKRDHSKYTLIGQGGVRLENLPKGRIGLASVRLFLTKHKKVNLKTLMETFPAEISKPYPFISTIDQARKVSSKSGRARYHFGKDEVLTVNKSKLVVTNQIGRKQLDLLIPVLKGIGITVK